MSKFLLANISLQLIGGLILFLFPQILPLEKIENLSLYIIRFLGIQAIFIGLFLTIWYQQQDHKNGRIFRNFICCYHFIAGSYMLFLYFKNYVIVLASVTHFIMFIVWIMFIFLIKPHGNQNY